MYGYIGEISELLPHMPSGIYITILLYIITVLTVILYMFLLLSYTNRGSNFIIICPNAACALTFKILMSYAI
jgi:hypothetical protein